MREWVDKLKRLLGDKRGLTLMELVVVLTILALLAAIVTPAVTGATTFGRATAAKGDIKNTQEAVDRYQGDNPAAKWPTTNGSLPVYALLSTAVDATMLKAIYWSAAFTDPRTHASKTFVPDYLRLKPAHAEESITLNAGARVKTFYDGSDVELTIGSVGYSGSAWTLTEDGKVILMLSADQY